MVGNALGIIMPIIMTHHMSAMSQNVRAVQADGMGALICIAPVIGIEAMPISDMSPRLIRVASSQR